MWKPILQSLMLAGVALGLPAILLAASFGGFGMKMDKVRQTDFFTWFHLQQTGKEQTSQGAIITFKPSGKQFHVLVTVKVITATNGDLTSMELILSRAFVDSKQDGIFARDIAKSLIRTAFAEGSDQDIQDLANQIEYLRTSSQTILLHKSYKPPTLPAEPTPGYLTYLGQQQFYDHTAAGKILRLENATVTGGKSLIISIKAQ